MRKFSLHLTYKNHHQYVNLLTIGQDFTESGRHLFYHNNYLIYHFKDLLKIKFSDLLLNFSKILYSGSKGRASQSI